MEERSSSEKKKHPEGPQDSLSHTIYDRLLGRWFHTHRSRVIVGHAIIVFVLIFSAALAANDLPRHHRTSSRVSDTSAFRPQPGSTSTFFIPCPV
jgi:hypothetical protein